MPDRLRLTADAIKALPSRDKRYYVHDSGSKGLRIVVSPSGTKVWYWVGRAKGRPQSIKLGTFPNVPIARAREEAHRINGEIAEGKQPKSRAKKAKEELTLGDVQHWYMENVAKPHRKTPDRDKKIFDRSFEHWRHLGLSEIEHADVVSLHVKIGETRGKVAANLALRTLSTMFRTAIRKLNYTGINPCHHVDKYHVPERDRFLQPQELVRFFMAIKKLSNPDARDLFMLCLFTGARSHNITAMEWFEIDYDANVWTIPAKKFKTRKPMLVVLTPEAIAVLKDREKFRSTSKYVFPSRAKSGHFTWPKNSWKLLKGHAGFTDVRIHDLRRTFASYQAGLNTSLHTIAKTLGHGSTKSTAIYARLQLDSVREAVSNAINVIVAIGKNETPVNGNSWSETAQSSSET